jgi:hypothetical protein
MKTPVDTYWQDITDFNVVKKINNPIMLHMYMLANKLYLINWKPNGQVYEIIQVKYNINYVRKRGKIKFQIDTL